MRAYGIPRNDDVAHPDMGDISMYGMPSHVGKFPGKGGEYRANLRSNNLRRTRRIWKKKERVRVRAELKNII